MLSSLDKSPDAANLELVERHRALYEGPEIDTTLAHLIRDTPRPTLSAWDIQQLLRRSRAVYFDSHVEVVSGHHTGVYLRFEAVARFPDLITRLASDMAEWIVETFGHAPTTGIITTSSEWRPSGTLLRQELSPRHRMLGYWLNAPANSSPGDCRCGWS